MAAYKLVFIAKYWGSVNRLYSGRFKMVLLFLSNKGMCILHNNGY